MKNLKKGLCICAAISMYSATIAQTVQWVVRPTSAQVENYGNLLKVRKSGKSGLMDHTGNEIIPARYDSITPFRDGFALALNHKGNQMKIEGVITEGDYDLQPLTENVYATPYLWFSEGKMPVKGEGGWGYLGTDGNMAIPCQFQKAYPFCEGFASIVLDDQAYFINRDMDYLNVEVGYGKLSFGSSFSNGEAVVYSGRTYNLLKSTGYVINRRGRIIRSYKIKLEDLKVNKSDHSVGNKVQLISETIEQQPVDTRFVVYEENGRYGYKKDGIIVLPAQLEKAGPVRGNMANVQYKGKNGVLRMVDGKFSVAMENTDIEVVNDLVNKGYLQITLPSALEDASIQLRMTDRQGKNMYLQANSTQGLRRTYSFQPAELPQNTGARNYQLEIWSDNLLMWKKNCTVNYVVKRESSNEKVVETKTVASTPKLRIAQLSLSSPQAAAKRANPKHDFYVTVTVSNSGDERGTATVSLSVDGQAVGNKSISVKGRGNAKAIFAVSNIRKERYARVKATLKDSRNRQPYSEANIHFMPFN